MAFIDLNVQDNFFSLFLRLVVSHCFIFEQNWGGNTTKRAASQNEKRTSLSLTIDLSKLSPVWMSGVTTKETGVKGLGRTLLQLTPQIYLMQKGAGLSRSHSWIAWDHFQTHPLHIWQFTFISLCMCDCVCFVKNTAIKEFEDNIKAKQDKKKSFVA